ncbi:MAG: extracellular solute-binding protein [Gammaproteobacteria bacterium]
MTTSKHALIQVNASLSRRRFLQGAAATAAVAAIGPWPVRSLGAGNLNVAAWGDYNPAFQDGGIFAAFEKKTGIKINYTTYGSNEEIENKLRAAGGKGFDIIFPSVDTGPNYYKDNLLAAIDESKLKVDQVIPAIYRESIKLGAAYRGKRYLIPFDWGTEGMTWDSSKHPNLKYGELSYGHLWADDMAGQVAARQKSVLVSLAIYLDAAGKVPSNRGLDLYKSEADCKRVFEECLKFAVAHKKNFRAYWNNGTEATAAFTDAGCTIGQTWDNTGTDLNKKVDKKWRYSMPKEGGLGWTDTLGIPAGAENVEQAYEFINFVYTPEMGAIFANKTGYNSCAVNANQHYDADKKAAFEMSYPDAAAIDSLWWWPAQTPFFAELRGQYVEKLTNA